MIGDGEKAGLSRPALGKIILEKLRYRDSQHAVISENKLQTIFEFENTILSTKQPALGLESEKSSHMASLVLTLGF